MDIRTSRNVTANRGLFARLAAIVIALPLLLLQGCSSPAAKGTLAPGNITSVNAFATDDQNPPNVIQNYSQPYVFGTGQNVTGVNWYRAYQLKTNTGNTPRIACSVYEIVYIHVNTNT